MMRAHQWAAMIWLWASGPALAAAPPPLLLPEGSTSAAPPSISHVTRSRAALISSDALKRLALRESDSITINLFDNAGVVGAALDIETRTADSFTITGRLQGEPDGWFTMAVEDEAVIAQVWSPALGTFQIRPNIDGRRHVVQQIDPAKLGGCGNGPAQGEMNAERSRPRMDADGRPKAGADSVAGSSSCDQSIDVMVMYTPRVRNALGSDAAVRALAFASIASSNICHANSEVTARLRLVHTAMTNYSEANDLIVDLGRLQQNGDGFMDEVFGLRAQYSADLVALLADSFASACGVAFTMTNPSPAFSPIAFSVIQQACALSNLTFAHELGHNLGCQHDWSDSALGAFAYSHGHRFIGVSGQTWRTVMAGSPGTRIPYFSNPLIEFDGVPTGVPQLQPNPADNARTINNTAAITAGFFAAAVIDCNGNTVSDACDIISGSSADVNENGVPDECDSLPCPPDELVKITAPDAESFDRFGGSVSMSDNRLVIGSYLDDDAGTASGSAYVYRRIGQAWEFEAKLVAADAHSFHHFGRSVAISAGGTFIVVGAYRDQLQLSDAGAIYLFRWTGQEWVQDAKIVNPDVEQADWFGWSVAWAGHEESDLFAVVGAPFDNEAANDAGAVYVIERTKTGWGAPVKLVASAAGPGDWLGLDVRGDLEGNRIIGGAPSTQIGPLERAGAAHVFQRQGETWLPLSTLVAGAPQAQARLGWSVAISSTYAMAGALNDDEFGKRAGAAFVFDPRSGAQQAKLRAADADASRQFGAAVALRSDRAVVGSILDAFAGSTPGAAHIFRNSNGVWTQQAKITALDGAAYDNFGISVAIAPTTDFAVAGAYFDDHHDTVDGGSASVFSLSIAQPDCNGNGITDQCDIDNGASQDANKNGVPDECETPPCPADITGDGMININDLLGVINHWGRCPPSCPAAPCEADITGDCTVNAADLMEVIENWGKCPSP